MREAADVITAFLDANVLYPALLRDILLRLASWGLFCARWSGRVIDEWTSALIQNRPSFPSTKIERMRNLMTAHFPDALVGGYEHRIEPLSLPDPDDRHVLAAAIECGARFIVTANLRDFPAETLAFYGVEPRHPDAFVLALLMSAPVETVATLRNLRLGLTRPTMTAESLLSAMSRQGLPSSAERLRAFMDAL